jgi:hypothetical protein
MTGLEAGNGITMMFGVHGGEKVGGSFVLGFSLSAAPMHEETVAEAPKHAHDSHRVWPADPALVVEMRHVQSLVQSAFDAPGRPVELQPLSGIQGLGYKAGHQRDGFRGVLAQMPAQERDLLHTRKVHLLGAGRAGAQHASFGLSFVELTLAGQRRRG